MAEIHEPAYKPLKINKEDPSKGSLIGIVVPSTVRVGVEKSRYGRTIIDKVTGAQVPDTSTFTKAEVMAEFIAKITKEGFRVNFPEDAIDQPIQGVDWANSAEERARHVINMLNNPEIEAIWAFSGGESAIEVVALLEEYDRDADNTEAKIRQAYKARYDKEPTDNFFKPRLTSIKNSEFYNPARGLPKRGIPYLGFSDASNLSILLGQKGVVSPFYANNAEHIMDTPIPESDYAMDLCTAIQYLTNDTPAIKYDGLVSLGRPLTEDVSGKMFSVNGAALASSEIGPSFKLSFREPTILALEFAEQDISLVGDILLKALENGTLKNVSGIALGRVGSKNLNMAEFEKGDKGIYGKLKEFVTNSGIPVCAAQLSATELEKNGTPSSEAKARERDNTWGHGYIPSGTIVKPFANYANAKMTTNGSLEVTGTRSLEDINISYASGIKDRVIKNSLYDDKEHKTIELNFTKIQVVQKVKAVDLSNVPFVATDIKTLRLTNGTNHQINSKDKAFVLSCSHLDPCVHSTLVESQLAGVLAGAKAIIIAIPEKFTGKERDIEASIKYLQSLPQILQDFSNRYLKGETPILIANSAELANGMVKGNISINQEKALATSPEVLEKMQKSFSELGKFTKEHKAMESKESWVQKMASRTLSGKSWDV